MSGNRKISFIICSKNDNWEGKPIDRLRKSIQMTCENTDRPEDYEILIGDWGSDVPIHEELAISPSIKCRVLYVPKEVTSKFNVPVSEVHCLNMLARRASGNFVGRVDQDTITHKRFFDFVESVPLEEDGLYWSTRSDLPPNCFDYSKSVFQGDPCGGGFWTAAIGIILMSKNSWKQISGYNEKMIYRNHMEHDLFHRAIRICKLYNLGCHLSAPFYHIYHDRAMGKVAKNNDMIFDQAYFNSLPTQINGDQYGLSEFDNLIQERIL